MKNKFHILSFLPIVTGCSIINSAHGLPRGDDIHEPIPVKICEIRKNPNRYEGTMVHVRGTYKSDHSFYSFMTDDSCLEMKTISVSDALHTNGDSSVVNFFQHIQRSCPVSGPSVCPINARVDAIAKVHGRPDGKMILEFKNIVELRQRLGD